MRKNRAEFVLQDDLINEMSLPSQCRRPLQLVYQKLSQDKVLSLQRISEEERCACIMHDLKLCSTSNLKSLEILSAKTFLSCWLFSSRCVFLLTVGSFLITVELLCLHLCFGAFLLTVGAFLLTVGVLLFKIELLCLQWKENASNQHLDGL